ncbi:DUF5615 family PIN-like protein [Thermocoleostomius sinensis A174]|uniref:DUF5615 family PIN-like protein n=1 Tax=Thermocoleostomius sinensis A174 TaxID=2016057 RepID=A0A9E8ZIN1_9CYAN|nr:DUF5615 family PIN-like protein [Thermocoleostomius sinensis A174]
MTTIWIDAHLSPAIATWITDTFGITALALRDLSLRDAEDPEIFEAAKAQGIIFMTKDSDFVDLVERLGSPPQIIWLTCGNTSNARLREILSAVLPETLKLLRSGEN